MDKRVPLQTTDDYSAFSLQENGLQENMGRESSIPVRVGHFFIHIELNQLSLLKRTHCTARPSEWVGVQNGFGRFNACLGQRRAVRTRTQRDDVIAPPTFTKRAHFACSHLCRCPE